MRIVVSICCAAFFFWISSAPVCAQSPAARLVRVSRGASIGGESSRVEVANPTFSHYAGSRGLWRGYVRGEGKIHLTLQILRGGIVESTRYIGSVMQRRWEKPTPFVFTAALPKGSGWSWLIVAEAS